MLQTVSCKHPDALAGAEDVNICGYHAVSDRGEKIGTIHDLVCDESGNIRYVVVDTGFWVFGKRVLVPVGMATEVDDERREVRLSNINRDTVDRLPSYNEDETIDEDYEDMVMGVYSLGQEGLERNKGEFVTDRARRYDQDTEFKTPQRLQLIEERLNVNKHREKAGEVNIHKVVETHQETIEVPVTHEKLVVETHPVGETDIGTGRETSEFKDETITIPLYEEQVEVTKRPVAAQEVSIRKESETVNRRVSEEVREERLDVNKEGNVEVNETRSGVDQPIKDRQTEKKAERRDNEPSDINEL